MAARGKAYHEESTRRGRRSGENEIKGGGKQCQSNLLVTCTCAFSWFLEKHLFWVHAAAQLAGFDIPFKTTVYAIAWDIHLCNCLHYVLAQKISAKSTSFNVWPKVWVLNVALYWTSHLLDFQYTNNLTNTWVVTRSLVFPPHSNNYLLWVRYIHYSSHNV